MFSKLELRHFRVGYVLALLFGHGCLGTAFMAPADLALGHLAMAMTPNLNLNVRKLFLFSFSFEGFIQQFMLFYQQTIGS